MKIYNPIVLCR